VESKSHEQTQEDGAKTQSKDIDETTEAEQDKLLDETSNRLMIERAEVYKALAKGVDKT
jgi:hypothetical protein